MITPIKDRIIVKRIEQEQKTASGIIIPENNREKPVFGKVIAVGDGRTLDSGQKEEMVIKQGDEVMFGKYAGTEVKIKGEEFLILKEEDVFGILNSEE